MAADAEVVVRLEPEPGPDGFWPRENYFAGDGENGYAVSVRAPAPCTIEPGHAVRLVVASHVPHLPYLYEGDPVTLASDCELNLVFERGGRVTVLTDERIATNVQHRFDPTGTVETTDAHGHPVVQRGQRGGPVIYRGEVVPS
jgi:hypothetical protein